MAKNKKKKNNAHKRRAKQRRKQRHNNLQNSNAHRDDNFDHVDGEVSGCDSMESVLQQLGIYSGSAFYKHHILGDTDDLGVTCGDMFNSRELHDSVQKLDVKEDKADSALGQTVDISC